MKIILEEEDIKLLLKNTNCIVVPDWCGDAITINKIDYEDLYYIVRWEEFDPCTDLLSAGGLADVLSDGVMLHEDEYSILLNNWRDNL